MGTNDAASRVAAGGPLMDAAARAADPRGSAADVAAVEALRRGDEDAFTRLVEQHHAALRRIARLYVSSPAVADEVVQDTWLAVIRGVWAFEGRSTLKTWILRILINRARTLAVREGRTVPLADVAMGGPEPQEARGEPAHPGLLAGDPHELDVERRRSAPAGRAKTASPRVPAPHDAGSSPEAWLLSQETRGRIRAAIEALPPRQRLVITMRDLEGCSSEEVCNVLGLSDSNQRVLLHRARSRVRATLAKYLQGG